MSDKCKLRSGQGITIHDKNGIPRVIEKPQKPDNTLFWICAAIITAVVIGMMAGVNV